AIDLVNAVLLEPGDTVILEEFTYQGYLNNLRRLGVKMVAAPLDEDGIRIDALAGVLADLKKQGTTPKYICTTATIQNPTGSINCWGWRATTACRSSRMSVIPI